MELLDISTQRCFELHDLLYDHIEKIKQKSLEELNKIPEALLEEVCD